MIDLLTYPLNHLVQTFEREFGKGQFHARALFREVFKRGNPDVLAAPEFVNSPRLSRALKKRLLFSPGHVAGTFEEQGLTKFLTRLDDGLTVESVIVPMTRYKTLCVSSQVGCKMGCAFCATAKMGFRRNLTVSEIVGQVYNARHTLGEPVKNVVFMGMGEPFDNFDAVMGAVAVMTEQRGFDIAHRHITLSTAGLVPGINRLAKMNLPGIRLAVSLNGPDDRTRSLLMPVNNRFPLDDLKKSLLAYPLPQRGTFLFEYILIKGVNDSPDHARALAAFIRPFPVRLNLIPYNPIEGFGHDTPDDNEMNAFAQALTRKGVFVIKRWSKGRSVSAGCGQLGRRPKGPAPLDSSLG